MDEHGNYKLKGWKGYHCVQLRTAETSGAFMSGWILSKISTWNSDLNDCLIALFLVGCSFSVPSTMDGVLQEQCFCCRLTQKLASPWFPQQKAFGMFSLGFWMFAKYKLCGFVQQENLHWWTPLQLWLCKLINLQVVKLELQLFATSPPVKTD